MRNLKKFLTQVIAVLLMFVLAACGGGAAASSDGSTENSKSASADESTEGSVSPTADESTEDSVSPTTDEDTENSGSDADENSDSAESSDVSGADEDGDTEDWPVGIVNVSPLGQSATATFANRYDEDKENVTITVLEIIRGEDALARIQQAMEGSIFTPEPPEDEADEYLIAKISFTLNSYKDADSKTPESFYVTDSVGARYPKLLAAMYFTKSEEGDDFIQLTEQTVAVGETITGYEIFQVKKDEPQPMVSYRNFNEDNSGGLWFELF